MSLEGLDNIIVEMVAGSHSYGLNIASSDVDIRGIFFNPPELSLVEPTQQHSDEKSDIVYYSIEKFFQLMMKGSPNMIEMLWIDEKFIKKSHPAYDLIRENRDLFLSHRAYHAFSGYAYQQIKKAKGQNKWINNPQPEKAPDPKDYLYWVPVEDLSYTSKAGHRLEKFAMRAKPLTVTTGKKLSKVGHGFNCNRMYNTYDYNDDFFKGNQLTFSSIAKEEESSFSGIVIFNETQYKSDKSNHKHYWGWIKNRNEARWETQENGTVDYDVKNMMHSIRLMKSGINIMKGLGPIVMMNDEHREFLLKVRAGEFTHEYLLDVVERDMELMESLKDPDCLPVKVPFNKINNLYKEVIELCSRGE